MSILERPRLEPMVGDPDDHRPNSSWALIAVGDAIPLHTHDIDEMIIILAGVAETRLGDEQRRVGRDAVIFIPAGMPHGTTNAGDSPLEVQAVFPATRVEIAMLERNAAPGTEDEAPRTTRYDLRGGAFELVE